MEEICVAHPSRMLEWDGYGLVCPSCVLGYPHEDTTPEESANGEG